MSECAKAHLQQSRVSKFSGGGLPDFPQSGMKKGKGGEGIERKVGREALPQTKIYNYTTGCKCCGHAGLRHTSRLHSMLRGQ